MGGTRASSTSWSQTECSGAQEEPWPAHPTLGVPGQVCLCPAPHRSPQESRQSPCWVRVGLPFHSRPSPLWLSASTTGCRSRQISLFLNFLGLGSNKSSQRLLPEKRNWHRLEIHCTAASTRPCLRIILLTFHHSPMRAGLYPDLSLRAQKPREAKRPRS